MRRLGDTGTEVCCNPFSLELQFIPHYTRKSGCHEYTGALQQYRLWTADTLLQLIEDAVAGLRHCMEDRSLLRDTNTFWDQRLHAWARKPGTQLPVHEVAGVIVHFLNVMHQVVALEETQADLSKGLKVCFTCPVRRDLAKGSCRPAWSSQNGTA